MPTKYTTILQDEAGTIALGAALARVLSPGLIIYLHGDLGAGKTTLTRSLLHAAGHIGHVKSPTYTLSEPYQIQLGGHPVALIHFDLYRMSSAEEFLEAGFREDFNQHNICIVEWPERGAPILPTPDIHINFTLKGVGREVKLHATSERGRACLSQLHFAPNL